MASMERRLPWFRALPPDNRSWIGLVAQAGIAAFVDWIKHPERRRPAVAGEVFGTAPRELARAVSLQQTVEMVRITIDVVEAQVDELAAPGGEAELREAVLRYTREVAFGAAQVYARTAEARGAWDARLEALVVDSVVRAEPAEGLESWASALGWSSSPVSVVVGSADASDPEAAIEELRTLARRARLDLLAGVQGRRLVERAIDGDETARAELIEDVYEPLLSGGTALIETVMTYLEQGFSLEAAGRLLFVHPNTVRYRLRRVAELTGLTPSDGRCGFTLWVAVTVGRLFHKRT
jgi:hypothetical protein